MSFGRKGGGSGSGVTQTVVNNSPWSAQQEPLQYGFGQARSIYDQGPFQYFPNSTVVPFSGQTEQALSQMEQLATAGGGRFDKAMGMGGQPGGNRTWGPESLAAGAGMPGSVIPGAINQGGATIGGQYLNSNPGSALLMPTALGGMLNRNPFTDETFNRAGQAARGQLASHFAGTGGLQSSMHEGAAGDAMANLANQIYGQQYENERNLMQQAQNQIGANYAGERGLQQQAIGGAGRLEQLRYQPSEQLAQVGATREAQAGAELQDQMARYNFNQQAPSDALRQYMALIGGGGYGGTQQTTAPVYGNPFVNSLALGFGGVGALGTLFGQGGIWPGALGR